MSTTAKQQLRVTFTSDRFSGTQDFPKTNKGEKRAEVFLRSLQKTHVTMNDRRKETQTLKVQIETVAAV